MARGTKKKAHEKEFEKTEKIVKKVLAFFLKIWYYI